mgnify:CR=1 FL=1
MGSRWLNLGIAALWLSTMSWLVVAKVLPPLVVGEPPSHQSVLEAQRHEPPVGWRVELNGRPVGWAVSRAVEAPNELSEVLSRVHFEGFSIDELAPRWLRGLIGADESPLGSISAEVENTLVLDPLGRPLSFDCSIRFDGLDEPVELEGTINGPELELVVRSGTLRYRTTVAVPSGALMGSALSPQSRLPGLRLGQRWTVPVYNPLRPRQPLEILQAQVVASEPTVWLDRTVETWLVEYRKDAGAELASAGKPRGRLWVVKGGEAAGMVVRQETAFFDSTILFERMATEDAARLAEFPERKQDSPQP